MMMSADTLLKGIKKFIKVQPGCRGTPVLKAATALEAAMIVALENRNG